MAVVALAAAFVALPQDGLAADLPVGPGQFVLVGSTAVPRDISVFYHRPAAWSPETGRILFVLHGNARDGESYRNSWLGEGDRYRVLIVVPQFDKAGFPGSAQYAQGGLVDPETGAARPPGKWTFTILGRVVAEVRSRTSAARKGIFLYGHSAGGQFVHRYLTFTRGEGVERAVAANAGWYTLPSFEIDFPYGLRGSPADPDSLPQVFARPLVILLGEDDTKRTGSLRQTAEADAQGPNRLARGRSYFAAAQRAAAALGAPFAWRLATVPGVGHSNAGMAPAAARALFE